MEQFSDCFPRTPHPRPGPEDPSLLTLQEYHRSAAVYAGHDVQLKIKRCDGNFWSVVEGLQDSRILSYLDTAGFGGVVRARQVKYDQALITALIERWHQETHSFHLPWGEATVTLQDVQVLWGLRLEGVPVTLVERERTMPELIAMCHELLGFAPEDSFFNSKRLKLEALVPHVYVQLPADASDQRIRCHARMYILLLLAGQLFADTCGNLVSPHWLDFVRDIEGMAQYSWGSAVLGHLYRQMCRASKTSSSITAGPYLLLQWWAWERMPTIRPSIVVDIGPGDYPRAGRWATKRTRIFAPPNCLGLYRDQLTKLGQYEFIWQPYTADVIASLPGYCTVDAHLWRARVPLIYWHIVEMHLPNRVLRQFGMRQEIPEPPETYESLHKLSRSGYQGCDWAYMHRDYIELWNRRAVSLVFDEPADPYIPLYQYLRWYSVHTVRYITPPTPVQPQRDGLRGDAGRSEYMMDTVTRIAWGSCDALTQDANPEILTASLKGIQQEAFGSMNYLDRGMRACLGVYDMQEAGASLHHNVAYRHPKVRDSEHSVRNTVSRRGRRRPRVQLATAQGVDTTHAAVTGLDGSSGFDTHVPTSLAVSSVATAGFTVPPHTGDGDYTLNSPYIPQYEQSGFDAYQTPTQIPAFGVDPSMGDDVIMNFVSGSSGQFSSEVSTQAGPTGADMATASSPPSCPHCGGSFEQTDEVAHDEQPDLGLGQLLRRSFRQQAETYGQNRRRHWKCSCSTTPRDKGKQKAHW